MKRFTASRERESNLSTAFACFKSSDYFALGLNIKSHFPGLSRRQPHDLESKKIRGRVNSMHHPRLPEVRTIKASPFLKPSIRAFNGPRPLFDRKIIPSRNLISLASQIQASSGWRCDLLFRVLTSRFYPPWSMLVALWY